MTSFTRPNPPQTPFPGPRSVPSAIPSSSPAFTTPAHPLPRRSHNGPVNHILPQTSRDEADSPNADPLQSHTAPVLPILLPPQTLRPIAFRTFTKKHNLTITSSALSALAQFVGKQCGTRWREEGLAEMVMEEIARSWKKADGKVIVDAEGERLRNILKAMEGCMQGGRIVRASSKGLNRQDSLITLMSETDDRPSMDRQESFGLSRLDVIDQAEDTDNDDVAGGIRQWLKVVDAFEQPRMIYNPARKHFERTKSQTSIFADPAQKTEMFRQRFHLVHQRLLRNESFQQSAVHRSGSRSQHSWKITPIANLLGRSGSGHLLLGMLVVTPSGSIAVNDLTGSIQLDISQAVPIDQMEVWLCPGMILLIDGVYEEDFSASGDALNGGSGVGGTISGRFIAFSVGAPRCETRVDSLGLSDANSLNSGIVGGGFGWVDFLGVGSERAMGSRMRRIETKIYSQHDDQSPHTSQHSSQIIMLGQVQLDQPRTLSALRKILDLYVESPPATFVLLGSFLSNAALSSPSSNINDANGTSSIAYKEHFDGLAAVLSDFPTLLQSSTFIFVPGDNDPWSSAFTAGAAAALPHDIIPEMFTNRIRRAFANANQNSETQSRTKRGASAPPGEAIWTTNPSRITVFGPQYEVVLFRDDISGRLRRNAVSLEQSTGTQTANEPQPIENDVDITSGRDVHMSDNDSNHASGVQSSASGQIPDYAMAHARKLVKTILDQGNLSPFPPAIRPVHWSYAHALSLFPLPNAMCLCDTEAEPFSLVYQGCCVMNPGSMLSIEGGRRVSARWIAFDVRSGRGSVEKLLL